MAQTPTAQRLFADYDANHRTVGNRVTHYFGIPLIVFGMLGLTARLPLGASLPGDVALVIWALATAFYVYLTPAVGLVFSLFLLALYFVARLVPMAPLWVAFFAGWILQFIGHTHYEKRQPAFFNNLRHLLVGPIWIFAKALRIPLIKS